MGWIFFRIFASMRNFRNLFLYCIPLLLALAGGGCHDGSSSVNPRLDEAEELLGSAPDSSLRILDGISASAIADERTKARYSLLYSIALDKNCIDTTTFEIIQPALDYYLRQGSADERLRTLYYQGRIFQNMRDREMAMKCFVKARGLKGFSDTLLYANLLVAQGEVFYDQYRGKVYVDNNLLAAEYYKRANRPDYEISSYSKALNGSVILDRRHQADSLSGVLSELVALHPEFRSYYELPHINYLNAYGSQSEALAFLDSCSERPLSGDMALTLAYSYALRGEGGKALGIIDKVKVGGNYEDSLKYLSIKPVIYEKMGETQKALDEYKKYVYALNEYHGDMFSRDELFADYKYESELKHLAESGRKNRIISIGAGCMMLLVIIILLTAMLYYRNRLKARIAGEENQRLMKENMDMEAEKTNLMEENSRVHRENAAQRQQLSVIREERDRLMAESRRLGALLSEKNGMPEVVRQVIGERLDILNGLISVDLSSTPRDSSRYKKWIESTKKDRDSFLDSTRTAFEISHPEFMAHLIKMGLSDREVNYACLFALGLNGKDVGNYMRTKNHYNVSSSIRKKLGMASHETNLALHIQNLLGQFDNRSRG